MYFVCRTLDFVKVTDNSDCIPPETICIKRFESGSNALACAVAQIITETHMELDLDAHNFSDEEIQEAFDYIRTERNHRGNPYPELTIKKAKVDGQDVYTIEGPYMDIWRLVNDANHERQAELASMVALGIAPVYSKGAANQSQAAFEAIDAMD